jgi:hypothetical protein
MDIVVIVPTSSQKAMQRPVQDKEARPYAVNDKQYVAVLVGSRQPNNIIPQAPELKNTSTASMLFVFGL